MQCVWGFNCFVSLWVRLWEVVRSGLGTELRSLLITECHGSGSSSYPFLHSSSTQVSSKRELLISFLYFSSPWSSVSFLKPLTQWLEECFSTPSCLHRPHSWLPFTRHLAKHAQFIASTHYHFLLCLFYVCWSPVAYVRFKSGCVGMVSLWLFPEVCYSHLSMRYYYFFFSIITFG